MDSESDPAAIISFKIFTFFLICGMKAIFLFPWIVTVPYSGTFCHNRLSRGVRGVLLLFPLMGLLAYCPECKLPDGSIFATCGAAHTLVDTWYFFHKQLYGFTEEISSCCGFQWGPSCRGSQCWSTYNYFGRRFIFDSEDVNLYRVSLRSWK